MMSIRRGLRPALTALGSRNSCNAILPSSLIPLRTSSSAPSPTPTKCAAADKMLFHDSADSAAPEVAAVTTLLRPRVVLYDGVCHLCHAGVKWVIQADEDKKIKFCCLQSRAAEPYMRICGLDRKDVLQRFLFVEGPGLYHQGSAAALKVLSYLPPPYSALSSLMIIPTPMRDAVYDHVAKRRYDWFGKNEDCLVLKEIELLERFIDWEELLERSRIKQMRMS